MRNVLGMLLLFLFGGALVFNGVRSFIGRAEKSRNCPTTEAAGGVCCAVCGKPADDEVTLTQENKYHTKISEDTFAVCPEHAAMEAAKLHGLWDGVNSTLFQPIGISAFGLLLVAA